MSVEVKEELFNLLSGSIESIQIHGQSMRSDRQYMHTKGE